MRLLVNEVFNFEFEGRKFEVRYCPKHFVYRGRALVASCPTCMGGLRRVG